MPNMIGGQDNNQVESNQSNSQGSHSSGPSTPKNNGSPISETTPSQEL